MKLMLTLAIMIAVMPPTIAQAKNMDEKPDHVATRELRELSDRWLNAVVRRDRRVFEDLLDDDVIVTNSDGNVLSKAEEINNKTALIHHVGFNNSVDEVRIYQQTAVMTGTFTRRYDFRGIGGPVGWSPQRYTFVWIKRGERWKIVAAQYTAVTEG
jgi:hypothetical protein